MNDEYKNLYIVNKTSKLSCHEYDNLFSSVDKINEVWEKFSSRKKT